MRVCVCVFVNEEVNFVLVITYVYLIKTFIAVILQVSRTRRAGRLCYHIRRQSEEVQVLFEVVAVVVEDLLERGSRLSHIKDSTGPSA